LREAPRTGVRAEHRAFEVSRAPRAELRAAEESAVALGLRGALRSGLRAAEEGGRSDGAGGAECLRAEGRHAWRRVSAELTVRANLRGRNRAPDVRERRTLRAEPGAFHGTSETQLAHLGAIDLLALTVGPATRGTLRPTLRAHRFMRVAHRFLRVAHGADVRALRRGRLGQAWTRRRTGNERGHVALRRRGVTYPGRTAIDWG